MTAAEERRRRWADLIEAARAAGRYWVVLESGSDGHGLYRRREIHLPSGVVIDAHEEPSGGGADGSGGSESGGSDDPGSPRYFTRSYFANRRTGEDLSCGSRQWDQGEFTEAADLEEAIARARRNVEERFAGMVAIYERQLQRKF